MKTKLFGTLMAALLTLGLATAPAQTTTPDSCPSCPRGGVPKKDGTGSKMRKGKGNHAGPANSMGCQKMGPCDGTGPGHNPQGGGRGRGRR